MTQMQNEFDCGLKGTALAYLRIFQKKGLSEIGKDSFIGILLEECRSKMESVPKHDLDDFKELILGLRDDLYEKLPTGDVDAFALIKLIKEHIKQLDDVFCPEEE